MALDFEQTYWRSFLSSSKLFSNVKDFLDDLRSASIKMAVITDLTAQIQFRKLVYWNSMTILTMWLHLKKQVSINQIEHHLM